MIKQKPKIYIGIDPAFRKNGFAISIIDLTDRTVYLKRFKRSFLDFNGWLLNEAPTNKSEVIFCVENSNKENNTVLFRKYKNPKTGARLTWKQAKYLPSVKLNENELISDAIKVGKNMGVSQMVVNSVEDCGYKCLNLSPKEKGAKWNAKEFSLQLKINKLNCDKKRTNEDERDATKMAIIALSRWYEAK